MSGKISEIARNGMYTQALDEKSVHVRVREKVKQKKNTLLPETANVLINHWLMAADKHDISAGGKLVAENRHRQTPTAGLQHSVDSIESAAIALSTPAVPMVAGSLAAGRGPVATKLKKAGAEGLSQVTLSNVVNPEGRLHSSHTGKSGLAGEDAKNRQHDRARSGNDLSSLPLKNAAIADSAGQEQQLLAAEWPVTATPLSSRDLKLKRADSDAETRNLPAVMLNRPSAVDSQANHATEHSVSSDEAMLRSKIRAQAAGSLPASRSLDLEYKFQRWSGEHSVKVSIPAEAGRDGNLTLLPSGTRAADALTSQFAQLTSHTPKLLDTERDGQQQQHRQPQDVEEEEAE
ncbi:hypothetical protein GKQ23_06010 [Erwinia sp. E602]|uniref:SpaN/EivJ family type III secretion system needle length determinant n=1 Tax=Erwinia sp. E602 TaxID=2675378 RepID=UPI001BAB0A3C|nr:type III secretion system needle length determinant, SpaN/EivJ family [Erwinia sp. E602]QUG74588.1 hypothetical protein GKQ23_06010 [Erwinia sp. E602]